MSTDRPEDPRSRDPAARPDDVDAVEVFVEVFDVGLARHDDADPHRDPVADPDGVDRNGAGEAGHRTGPSRRWAAVAVLGLGALALATDPFGSDPGEDGGGNEPGVDVTVAVADLPPPPTLEPLPPVTETPPTTEPPPSTLVRSETLLPPAEIVDAELGDVDLFAAIRTSRLDRPLRATTLVTIGQRGFEQTVELASDPTSGLIGVEIIAGTNEQTGVIDAGRSEGYVLIAPGAWSSYPLGVDDGARWRRLVLGPLDADVLFRAAALDGIRRGPTVSYEPAAGDSVVAQAFAVSTTAEFLPGWVPYALGPQGEAAALDDDAPIDLRVLVDGENRIRETSWAIPFGNTRQVVTHRLDYPDESPVALPEIATL